MDAIALQEVTPEFEETLETSGLLETFPHRVGTARDDAGGTMLLSRTSVELVGDLDAIAQHYRLFRAECGVRHRDRR